MDVLNGYKILESLLRSAVKARPTMFVSYDLQKRKTKDISIPPGIILAIVLVFLVVVFAPMYVSPDLMIILSALS